MHIRLGSASVTDASPTKWLCENVIISHSASAPKPGCSGALRELCVQEGILPKGPTERESGSHPEVPNHLPLPASFDAKPLPCGLNASLERYRQRLEEAEQKRAAATVTQRHLPGQAVHAREMRNATWSWV